MEATILESDGGLALASIGAVYISILRTPLTVDGVVLMARHSKRLYEARHGKSASIAIIEPSAASAASAEVRERSAELAKAHPILGAAIVIEGSGFRPAATRTLVAGMYLVTKKAYPHKIVSTAEEGAAWLVPILGQSGIEQSADAIVAAVAETRAMLTPR
jgi:hypothetical protein